MSCVICVSSVLRRESVGASCFRELRSSLSRLVESVRLGIMLGLWPRGMCLWAAAVRTRPKLFSLALPPSIMIAFFTTNICTYVLAD